MIELASGDCCIICVLCVYPQHYVDNYIQAYVYIAIADIVLLGLFSNDELQLQNMDIAYLLF